VRIRDLGPLRADDHEGRELLLPGTDQRTILGALVLVATAPRRPPCPYPTGGL